MSAAPGAGERTAEVGVAALPGLWITRMDRRAENDIEVCRIDMARAAETLSHARRVVRKPQGPDALEPGDLLVTLMTAEGDIADDEDPLRVPADTAEWFLFEWLKVPRSWCVGRGRAIGRPAPTEAP